MFKVTRYNMPSHASATIEHMYQYLNKESVRILNDILARYK